MLGNLHVRFGVGVRAQSPGLHHVKVEPRSNNAIAAGLSSFKAEDRRLKAEGKQEEGASSSSSYSLKPTASSLQPQAYSIISQWTSPGIRRNPSRRRRSCGLKIGRSPTTLCPTTSSTGCWTPGSATLPAYWYLVAGSISGAATPTVRTIRRF